MSQTSATLLDRLRSPADEAAWRRLVEIYTPLVRNWLRRQNVTSQDTDDLVQEVMSVVVRRLSSFEHNGRTGAFRTWLRTITVNSVRDFYGTRRNRPLVAGELQTFLTELSDPNSGLSRMWDSEHDRFVTRRLLELIRPTFDEKTWQAFARVTFDGVPAAQAAEELGMTANAVFIAKSRVLGRLRQEAAGIIDS